MRVSIEPERGPEDSQYHAVPDAFARQQVDEFEAADDLASLNTLLAIYDTHAGDAAYQPCAEYTRAAAIRLLAKRYDRPCR